MKSWGLVGGVLAGEWPGLQVLEGVFDGFLLDESSDRKSWAIYSWYRNETVGACGSKSMSGCCLGHRPADIRSSPKFSFQVSSSPSLSRIPT